MENTPLMPPMQRKQRGKQNGARVSSKEGREETVKTKSITHMGPLQAQNISKLLRQSQISQS